MTYALAVHGGAGTILKSNLTPELEAAYHAGLSRALRAGEAILKGGGPALNSLPPSTSASPSPSDQGTFDVG